MHRQITASAPAARHLRHVITAVGLAAALYGSPASAAQPALKHDADGAYAAGRVLIQTRAGLPDHALAKMLAPHGAKARRLGKSALKVVDLPAGGDEQRLLKLLRRHRHIEFAELDRQVAPGTAPNDPYYGSAWHLTRVGATTAWDASQGAGVKIAVLDSGVDGSHPDLAAQMVPGWNIYDNNSDTSDVYGHGTKVAGAAAAVTNNGTGVAGVAGSARIMPVRISDTSGYAYWSTIASGLTWAADNGARVANISYAAYTSSAVRNAASYMKSKGGLVFVSAGNNGIDEGAAATTTLIPVSATASNDVRASWSSYGAFVALSAPGAGIWTTVKGGTYGSVSGTSFAAPVTAGVAALVMAANPALTPADVEQLLFSTAVDLGATGRDSEYGYGRVEAAAAVQAALDSGADSPPADTEAPKVAITSPTGSQSVSGLVAVDVTASDNVGLASVGLYANGSLVAVDKAAPYAFSWDAGTLADGSVTLVAKAVDAAGNSANSASVSVMVANATSLDTTPPVIQSLLPYGGKVYGTVTVQSTASDDAGEGGLGLTLWINGKQVATATGGSLQYKWNTRKEAKGEHTLLVQARDAAGNTTTRSATVTR